MTIAATILEVLMLALVLCMIGRLIWESRQ